MDEEGGIAISGGDTIATCMFSADDSHLFFVVEASVYLQCTVMRTDRSTIMLIFTIHRDWIIENRNPTVLQYQLKPSGDSNQAQIWSKIKDDLVKNSLH